MEGLRSRVEDPADVRVAEEEIEGLMPAAEATPRSVQELSSILSFASEEGLAVIPKGGGTAIHIGNRPRKANLLLHLSGVREGFEHSAEDLVATLPAGMVVAEANRLLARHDQYLPLEPPLPGDATVGGALAANSFGPRAQSLGLPRDSVLGMVVVLADGTITRAGGRVVKNVTGYDMSKLYIGSLGSLGIIVEATFKLGPLPEAMATLAFTFPTLDDALRAGRDIEESGLEPTGLTILNNAAASSLKFEPQPYHLLVEFGELKEVVRRQVRAAQEVAKLRGSEGSFVRHGEESRGLLEAAANIPASRWNLIYRGTVPPAATDAFLDGLLETSKALGPGLELISHPGLGIILAGLPQAPEDAVVKAVFHDLTELIVPLGGHLLLEKAPPKVKMGLDVWGPAPPHFNIMARLKAEFDPVGILNPGRFMGGL